jgi:tripartite-type tricarboxylate transporter receptor subunit TctC
MFSTEEGVDVRNSGIGIILSAGIAACAGLTVADSWAQAYPVKPIRMLIGFSAGSAPDGIARVLAPVLLENLGHPVVVENRPGAGGSIATASVAKAPADGYTLLMMAAADTLQPALRGKLPYDLERDLAPVAMIVTGTAVLAVHPSLPARNVRELVALARAHPGKLNYGSSGLGSSSHLMGELFNEMAGVKMTHVPYKGSAESALANASGQIEISFPSVIAVLTFMQSGKLRPLAVTSARRATLLASLPTVNEAGLPGYDRSTFFGVTAPVGVPRDIVRRLNAAINAAANAPDIKSALIKQGLEPRSGTPEEFAAFIHQQLVQNGKLIKSIGASID